MTSKGIHRVSGIAICAIVGLFSSAAIASAQVDAGKPSPAEVLSAAAKASPELAKELAKELDTTPEQAAGTAAVLFGVAKSFLKPEDFAKVAKLVPGMDGLLAALPPDTISAAPVSTFTPGIASSSSSTPGMTMAASNGISSAIGALSKLGIKPEMLAKALPFMSEYLKKKGGAAIGSLLGGVFKTGK